MVDVRPPPAPQGHAEQHHHALDYEDESESAWLNLSALHLADGALQLQKWAPASVRRCGQSRWLPGQGCTFDRAVGNLPSLLGLPPCMLWV
mmetsp:Transcript_2505/g.5292  ORF Transcript_2505/g.5292 Transcript_2505/m.5292 type:complete len:91 (-) Transcript_2505:733-1005(-)